MPHLEVRNLTIGFVHKPLIKELSFDIQSPAFVAVIGHNGCGKSTFFKSLTGAHPYSGEIFIDGINIHSVTNLAGKGYVTLLEQRNNLNFNIIVKDLILMGRFRFTSLFKDYSGEDEKIVSEVTERIGIRHLLNEDFLNLSGGEQQLVWLAQIMVQDPEIILLDEPTQQLDVYNRKRIFDLMQLWSYEKKKLLFCITHDLYNLENLQGYLLNLSSETPRLLSIDSQSVEENLKILEEGKAAKAFRI